MPGPNCPVVKNFKCGYCKEMGHTIKHCPILQAKKQYQQKMLRQCPQPKEESVVPSKPKINRVKILSNHFGLMEDESEMPNSKPVENDTWPKINMNRTLIHQMPKSNPIKVQTWAKIVQKPAPEPVTSVDMAFGNIGNWGDLE